MTIYDQDYMAELDAQNQAYAGVTVPVAADQEASAKEAQPLEQPVDQSAQVRTKVDEPTVSDKEYNFKALREELAQFKQQSEYDRRELEEIRHAQRVQRQPEPPRERAIDKINSDDLVTGAQFKQAMAEREAEYQLMLGELQVKAQHSDYDEVTSKYGVPLIEKEPDLAQGFLASNNKASYLYKLGKMAMLAEQRPEAHEPVIVAPQASQNAQRIVENAKKPGTLSNPTGGAGNLSKADYYASMSDQDFHKFVSQNLAEV